MTRIRALIRHHGTTLFMTVLALVLAWLGQRQFQHPEPHVLSGLVCFGVAVWAIWMLQKPSKEASVSIKHYHGLALVGFGLVFGAIYLHQQQSVEAFGLLALWLSGITIFLIACWQFDRERAAELQPLGLAWNRWDTALIATVVLIAAFFRISELQQIPKTLSGDEANMAMEAVRIRNGTLNDPFTVGWFSHPTLWFYLQALSISIFGETIAGVRMLSAVLGSITIAGTYLFGRLLFTRRIALLGALLLATYHLHIHYSRFALNNVADPLWGVIILSCWVSALKTRRFVWWAATGVGIGMALYFYNGARLFVPLLAVLIGIEALIRWRRWREFKQPAFWRPVVILGAGLLIAGGPIIQHFTTHPEDFMARVNLLGWTSEDRALEAERTGSSPVRVILWQVERAFLAFNAYPDVSTFYDDTRPLLWGWAAILFTLGLGWALLNLRHLGPRILVVWFGLAIVIGSVLLRSPPNSPRYVTLTPVVCLLIASIIDLLVQPLDKAFTKPRWERVGSLVAIGVAVYLSVVSINGYFRDYVHRERIGGINTHVAMALTQHLIDQPAGTQVWFMVPPRMYYHGFAMFDYLAGHVQGNDIIDPITTPPEVPPASPKSLTIYAATPERVHELALVQQRYPGSDIKGLTWLDHPEPLIYVYQVSVQR